MIFYQWITCKVMYFYVYIKFYLLCYQFRLNSGFFVYMFVFFIFPPFFSSCVWAYMPPEIRFPHTFENLYISHVYLIFFKKHQYLLKLVECAYKHPCTIAHIKMVQKTDFLQLYPLYSNLTSNGRLEGKATP